MARCPIARVEVVSGQSRPRRPSAGGSFEGETDAKRARCLGRNARCVVSDALVNFGPEPTADELYVAESYSAVSSGLKYDLKLLGKYFSQILGFMPKP